MDSDAAAGAAIPTSSGSQGQQNRDTDELLDPVLFSNDNGAYKLKTVPAFSIHLLISTIISCVGIGLATLFPEDRRCDAYFIMLYLRATFWVITFLFDHFVKKQHDNLRMNGYHDFHRETSMQKGVPLQIVSLWNSMLLGVQALIHHYYGNDFEKHCAEGWLSPISYITTFNVAENLLLAATHGCYINKVLKFNKAKLAPDVLRGADRASGSLGLMQPGGDTAELLERQADLISYLKDHTYKINQKLHQMQTNVRPLRVPQIP
ncbi:transmembrane protein 192 [Drosophila sulfurigaster albostrigata]|uniref:transmembrane protein 192 n=1 Tax=Drosophila sulfurigaster albostrigata TaxID=89887 RepID=UPI002D21B2D0|nr:transmembrane protein 192 [Drosophila sulfurigaster albostrigata]